MSTKYFDHPAAVYELRTHMLHLLPLTSDCLSTSDSFCMSDMFTVYAGPDDADRTGYRGGPKVDIQRHRVVIPVQADP